MNVRALPPIWGVTVIRLMAGLIITMAGYSKLTGGGFEGFAKTAANFGLPAPELWGVVIPLLEFIGGLMILTGLFSRWIALAFLVEYAVTSFVLKAPRQPPFGGFDSMRIDLMLWTSAIMLVLVGPGRLALQNLFLHRAQRVSMAEGAATG